MAQVVIPENFSNICHAHWGTWMATISLLNSIHTEGANGIC